MKTVILAYDPTWAALEWAKAHCKSYITNEGITKIDWTQPYHPDPAAIEYFFSDERDATLFRLMWAK